MRRIDEAVYCATVDEDSLERPRRMTVFVLPDRRLVVHSGIREHAQGLDELGQVSMYLRVPNPHHDPDAAWFVERYPSALVLAPTREASALREASRVDGTFEQDWPDHLDGVLQHYTVEGARFTETVFLHVPSRSLVLVDLAFHLPERLFHGRPLGRWLMRLNDAGGRFGITRLTRLLIRDRERFRASLSTILGWDFDRIILSHGDIVERGGREVFRAGFPGILAPG